VRAHGLEFGVISSVEAIRRGWFLFSISIFYPDYSTPSPRTVRGWGIVFTSSRDLVRRPPWKEEGGASNSRFSTARRGAIDYSGTRTGFVRGASGRLIRRTCNGRAQFACNIDHGTGDGAASVGHKSMIKVSFGEGAWSRFTQVEVL
jgi:hypothetical protein